MSRQAGATPSATRLGVWLHSQVCMSMSWSEDCQQPNGGEHARTSIATAKKILSADNPASELHAALCDAEIQSAHKGCPVREVHEKKCWEFLADVAGLTP